MAADFEEIPVGGQRNMLLRGAYKKLIIC